MIRIVASFFSPEADRKVTEILERSGLAVRFHCRTGAETVRAIGKMGGGVVICSYKLADTTAEQLAEELAGQALFLVLAKGVQLDLLENDELFSLPLPLKSGELLGSVNMLVQMDQKRASHLVPRRSDDEKAVIEHAKRLLMDSSGMTEDRAHRYIQRRSMDAGAKMVDTARLIIQTLD